MNILVETYHLPVWYITFFKNSVELNAFTSLFNQYETIDIKQRLLEDQRYTRWHPGLFVYYAVRSYYG